MRLAGHRTRMGKMRNVYTVLIATNSCVKPCVLSGRNTSFHFVFCPSYERRTARSANSPAWSRVLQAFFTHLTPWSKVVLEMTVAAYPVKRLPAFYLNISCSYVNDILFQCFIFWKLSLLSEHHYVEYIGVREWRSFNISAAPCITLPSIPRFPKWSLPFRFSN
jgi:hypothetical protein